MTCGDSFPLTMPCHPSSKPPLIKPLTPISDQDRISPYSINTISSRKAMRIEKRRKVSVTCRGILVDSIPNSQN